jgi:hypothetical protein
MSKIINGAVFVLLLCTTIALSYHKAYATLAGENGTMVYIDTTSATVDNPDCLANPECEVPSTTTYTDHIVTTNNTATSPAIVASEQVTPITSATISASTATGAHTIVYATISGNCISTQEIEAPLVGCDPNNSDPSQVVNNDIVYKSLTVSADGQALTPAITVTSASPEDPTAVGFSLSQKLSTSPDSTNVISTVLEISTVKPKDQKPKLAILSRVDQIDLALGTITNIITPRQDLSLSAGYAQNGNIYYSRHNEEQIITGPEV